MLRALVSSNRSRGCAWWLGLAFVLGVTSPYLPALMNANERPRLMQAVALVEDGTWAIDSPSVRDVDAGIDVAHGAPKDPQLYPNKPPGATFPAALAWLLLGRPLPLAEHLEPLTVLARVLGSLLPTLALLAFAAWRLTPVFGRAPTRIALVLYALATPAWTYAKVLFGHQLSACLLFVGVVLVADALERRVTRTWALVGGLLAGCAIAVEYAAAFAGLPLALVCVRGLFDRSRRFTAVQAALGALVPVLLLALYHHAVFGAWWRTGYHNVVRPEFAEIHGMGLLGLHLPTLHTLFEHALSPWGGLLFWAPLALLGWIASVWHLAHPESALRLCFWTFGVYLLVVLGLEQGGGWRVGPRYLVPAFAFVIPGLARLVDEARTRPWLAAALIGLGLAGVGMNGLAANLFPQLPPTGNPLADLLVPLAAEGYGPDSLLRVVGLRSGVVGVVLAGAVALLVASGWAIGGAWRSRTAWWSGLCLGIVVFLAALVLPSGDDHGEDTLLAIQRIWWPPTEP